MSKRLGKAIADTLRANLGAEGVEVADESVARATERKYAHGILDGSRPGKQADDFDASKATSQEKALAFGGAIKYLALTKNNKGEAIDMAKKEGNLLVAKALGSSTMSGGGALIPEEFSSEFIKYRNELTSFRQSGVRTVQMRSGNMTISHGQTPSSASYGEESTNITASQPSFGQLRADAKTLRCLVPASNEMLHDALNADEIIRNDMAEQMAEKEDITFLRSNGANSEPRGVLHQVLGDNKFNAGTASVVQATSDLSKMIRLVKDQKVRFTTETGVWHFSPRTEFYLRYVLSSSQDTNPFGKEMANGRLLGYKYFVNTAIPDNLGSGDKSEIYFFVNNKVVIYETGSMQVDVSGDASYFDGSNLVSCFARNETAIRAISRHDLVLHERGAEAAVLEDVDWGA